MRATDLRAVHSVFLFALVYAALSAMCSAAEISDFTGAWLNTDLESARIPRLLISSRGSTLTIHAYSQCDPIDCDWGSESIAFVEEPFDVVFARIEATYMLRISLNKDELRADVLKQRKGFPDEHWTEWFTMMTQPDLVIADLAIDQEIITHQREPWTWVTMTVENRGAAYPHKKELQTWFCEVRRDGEAIVKHGTMIIPDATPMAMGATLTYEFAVGHDNAWPPGDYEFELLIDTGEAIPEANEKNNISETLAFCVLPEHDLAGQVLFNRTNMKMYTDVIPEIGVYDYFASEYVPDAVTYYSPTWGIYTAGNLPAGGTYIIYPRYHLTGAYATLPGNYITPGDMEPLFTPATMTPEQRETADTYVVKAMHMTHPWDNMDVKETFAPPYPVHQPGIRFSWDAVPEAAYYRLGLGQYRFPEHPDGGGPGAYGQYLYTAETTQVASLPVSEEFTYYFAVVLAYNEYDELVGVAWYTSTAGSYGRQYRFTVDYDCYPDLPAPKLYVTHRRQTSGESPDWILYQLQVANYDAYPAEMFEPAPDLGLCGSLGDTSRSRVDICDEDDVCFRTMCSYDSPSDLRYINFGLIVGAEPDPEYVYIKIHDLRCDQVYTSSLVDTSQACPIGDLNGDCLVNVADLSLMAQNWLAEPEE